MKDDPPADNSPGIISKESKEDESEAVKKFIDLHNKRTRLIVSLSFLAIILFIVVAVTVPLKDKIFQVLYPKPVSLATDPIDDLTNQLLEAGLAYEQALQQSAQIGFREATPLVQPISFSGVVFIDNNSNGRFDSTTDTPMANEVVILQDDNCSGQCQQDITHEIGRFTTASDGKYTFKITELRWYRITHYVPTGYIRTTDDSRPFDPNKDLVDKTTITWDFGVSPKLTVKGVVFEDANRNGVLDNNEQKLSGEKVILQSIDGAKELKSMNTNSSGEYLFTNLDYQDYRITHYVPSGYVRTTDDSRPFDQKDLTNKTVYTWNFGIAPKLTDPSATPQQSTSSAVQAETTSQETQYQLNKMVDIAKKRKELLLQKIKDNPQEFLNKATLADKINTFPESVRPYIEEKKEIQGKLTVVHGDDFENKKSTYEYLLQGANGESDSVYYLYFVKSPPQILSGSEVRVKGVELDQKMALETGNAGVVNGVTLQSGWPQRIDVPNPDFTSAIHGDIDGDGDIELVVALSYGGSLPPYYLGLAAWHHDGKNVLGWPKYTDIKVANPKATLADLDKDGKLEILVDTYQGVYAYRHNGQSVLGFPVASTEKFEYAQIVARDLNNDGYPEIIAGAKDTGNLYIWDRNGRPMANWPKASGFKHIWSIAATPTLVIISTSNGADASYKSGEIQAYNLSGQKVWSYPINNNSSLSVGDLTGDGTYETIFYKDNISYDPAGNPIGQEIVTLDSNGKLINSWSAGPHRLHLGLVLGDVDNDGKLEIAGASAEYRDGHVYLWRHDGTLVNGWPKVLTENVYIPLLADIDGDGQIEIVSSLSNYRYLEGTNNRIDFHNIYAWNADGSEVTYWPIRVFSPNDLGSVNGHLQSDLLDLDQDGDIDLATGIGEGGMYVLDLNGKYDVQKIPWGTYRHDSYHTGILPNTKPSPCPPDGDVNDDKIITDADAELVLKIVAGSVKATADQQSRADVDGDGQVTSVDALRIQRYVAGTVSTFPACK